MNTKRVIRYPSKIKQEAVDSIVRGELFLEEVMVKYGIMKRSTVINWLKKYVNDDPSRRRKEGKPKRRKQDLGDSA